MSSYRSKSTVVLVMLTFFVVSFITNIMGPIFPALVHDYQISLSIAGFFPFAFFIAYGVMSIPAGVITERLGAKPTILIGFGLSAAGALLLVLMPTFISVLASLFLIGSAMAILQVVINPLLRIAGGEENFAFNSVAAQLVFGAAATISPLVYSYLAGAIKSRSTSWVSHVFFWVPPQLSWLAMYGIFALLSAVMILVIAKLHIPKLVLNEDEKVGAWDVHLELLRSKTVRLFFIAIIAYVATEQGIANSMSLFLQKYHGLNPEVEGANAVSQFWMMMSFGCLLGLGLLRLMDSRNVLKIFSVAAISCYITALYSPTNIATLAFPAVGFCISVMFSVIFSLALNSVPKHHGSFAGILCSGIIGGALASPIIGAVADATGDLRTGMFCVFITLGYILSIGFWARPLIINKIWQTSAET